MTAPNAANTGASARALRDGHGEGNRRGNELYPNRHRMQVFSERTEEAGVLALMLDKPLAEVKAALQAADPAGEQLGQAFRDAFDFLYDGQRTGRYSPSELSKTEKAHCGSVVEINIRRSLDSQVDDGNKLDFRVAGHEVDCKFSFKRGGWMLPPECFDELLLVCHADDEKSVWSVGLVRASSANLNPGRNRDGKTTLSAAGRSSIEWLFEDEDLPPNALLHQSQATLDAIFGFANSGQKRVDELFRRVQLTPISRAVVATVAQQVDYMKRVRSNVGARSNLQPEGILIAGGDFEAHRSIALQLGAPDIRPGEFVSFTVVPAGPGDQSVTLDGRQWRIAEPNESAAEPAPTLPSTRRRS